MQAPVLPLSKVVRSPSLHSEQSSLSDSRHVSFNQDVAVKRIPKKPIKATRSVPINPGDEFSGRCQTFDHVPPPSDQDLIAEEAEQILKQLQDIECSVSSDPKRKRVVSPTRILTPSRVLSPTPLGPLGRIFNSNPHLNHRRSPSPFGSRQSTLERRPFLGGRLSKSSSDLIEPAPGMRVEGTSEQEDCPSPADNRLYGLQALSKLDNALNGKVNNLYRDRSASAEFSPSPKKNNFTPPKPPRKAPSTSPPNIRKGYTSLDELEFVDRRPNMYESEIPKYNMDMYPNSYTGTNPNLNHLRGSPSRYSPNSRQSPSRGNQPEKEILSSPSQVLYATISADKNKSSNLKNHHMANSASQTVQSGFRPVSSERMLNSRTLSKENILDDPPYRFGNNPAPPTHASRSLERFVDSDKENRRQELKARIHVTSPHRFSPDRAVSRKPYKTTINTANDTIQYRGFSTENLKEADRQHRNQFKHSGKRMDTEHYKVPKNPAPVPQELLGRRTRRNDSEISSAPHNGNHQSSERQFASTSLVRNAEKKKGLGEYDREGRRIHTDRSGERTRAYSGYSTSPERELSPDRYMKYKAGSKQHRSPSSSPTRPPRTRGTQGGEIQVPIRREHSGRRVDRTPSTRAAATSRSPIKKIQRVHNEIQAEQPRVNSRSTKEQSSRTLPGSRTLTLSRDRTDAGARLTKTLLKTPRVEKTPEAEDRFSKFTEYRGDGEQGSRVGRRASQSVGDRMQGEPRSRDPERETMMDRERGQSVPPGANIDSMRDFYKTSQFRSMYHLPPNPSRPAPVLDRTTKMTDQRTMRRERTGDSLVPPPRRPSRTSVSEGELTDEAGLAERVLRQRNKFINNFAGKNGENMRRSTEKEEPRTIYRGGEGRRQGSREKRPAPQPPTQRIRRSSVEVLETSESESPRLEKPTWSYSLASTDSDPVTVRHIVHRPGSDVLLRPGSGLSESRPESRPRLSLYEPGPFSFKAKSDVGGRWNGQSDVDTDYRREMAGSEPEYRREVVASVHSEARGRDGGRRDVNPPPSIYQQAATLSSREIEISQDDDEEEVVRSPTSLAREEERRKILQLEEDRRRKGTSVSRSGTSVSRSGSRVTKLIGLKGKGKVPDTENESQYSGHSSSSMPRKEPILKSRLNNGARVKRTGSNVTSVSRAASNTRRKLPGSVTSSINSSESELGSGQQSAGSRGTNSSNKSVYLHATAVADIPTSAPKHTDAQAQSNLKNSKKISRSISLLTPFKQKQAKEKEMNYDSSGNQVQGSGKPPRPPPARRIQPVLSKDKKFASSSDLLRDEPELVVAPVEEQKSLKVSRSVSMPKDTRLAGWFKKRKRV